MKDSGRDGTVPQVPHRQGIGLGGTEEDVSRGMGCTAAGRTGGFRLSLIGDSEFLVLKKKALIHKFV